MSESHTRGTTSRGYRMRSSILSAIAHYLTVRGARLSVPLRNGRIGDHSRWEAPQPLHREMETEQ